MSFKQSILFPANPNSARGSSTKLSSSKEKVVYANGRSIIIRNLDNPGLSVTYSGHVQNTTVARISPSGYYCASADAVGNVKIWDTVGQDQTLKGEYKVISGKINDLEWDGESKRIIAVGDGREKFGHAFMMDSGSSTGEISGHSKVINAVSIRHQRPFRAATAGDDNLIIFHQGAPYKYDKTIKTHTKYVQDVRYAPSGDHFVSVGSDAKLFVYDGKTGDTVAEFTDSPHKGSIMAVSWGPSSKELATSSADRTVKLWDVEAQKAKTTWTLGSEIDHQQVGNTWSGEQNIVSLSVYGDLNVFDPRVGDKPARILTAPQKAVTASVATSKTGTFFVGSADGRVFSYSTSNAESRPVAGETHSNLVSGITAAKDGKAYTVGFDDKLKEVQADSQSFSPASVSTAAQPKGVAVTDDSYVFIAEIGRVEVFKSNQKVSDVSASFSPSSIAATGTSLVAVGGEDQKVHLYDWDGKTLKPGPVLDGNKGVVSAVAFSPDGKFLAAGDSTGRIALFDVPKKSLVTSRWSFHTAKINSLSWTSDSKHCASGSLDTHAYIWSVDKPMKNIAIKNAGPGGVNTVVWIDGTKLGTAGADGSLRVWDVTFHA